jgi:hypothetical protein
MTGTYSCSQCAQGPFSTLDQVEAHAKYAHLPGPGYIEAIAQHLQVEDFKGSVDGAGVKNEGLPLCLIPPTFIEGLARVYAHGAKKYAPNNWMRGYDWTKSLSALKRHVLAVEKGEDTDPESGELHLYHVAWHCATLGYFTQHAEYAKFDDRVYKLKTEWIGNSVGGYGPVFKP